MISDLPTPPPSRSVAILFGLVTAIVVLSPPAIIAFEIVFAVQSNAFFNQWWLPLSMISVAEIIGGIGAFALYASLTNIKPAVIAVSILAIVLTLLFAALAAFCVIAAIAMGFN